MHTIDTILTSFKVEHEALRSRLDELEAITASDAFDQLDKDEQALLVDLEDSAVSYANSLERIITYKESRVRLS